MARIAAVIANGGRLVTPQVVERVTKADGSTQHPEVSGGRVEQVISRRTANALQSALRTAASYVVSQGSREAESKISGRPRQWPRAFLSSSLVMVERPLMLRCRASL